MTTKSLLQLETGIIPERYARNIGTIGIAGQIKLLKAKVLVIGAGGLGGTAVELLARQGVGFIRVVDLDCFTVHNLNRQILCTENNLGAAKVAEAVRRVNIINTDTIVEGVATLFSKENADALLQDIDVVVDALDSINTRLLLSRRAQAQGKPVVHGAIAGFTGQVMTVMPCSKGLEYIYQEELDNRPSPSMELGNPATMPTIVAALQVQEVIKIITGNGELLTNQLLVIDIETNSFELIKLT